MASQTAVPTAVETKVVRRPYFDMNTAERKSKEVTVTLPGKPESLEKALEAAGGDQAVLLTIIHDGLKKHAVKEAKKNIELGENEVPSGIVAKFIVGFLPMFAGEKTKADARKKAIAFVRGNESIMTAFKAFVSAQIAAGAADESENEEEDSDE